MKTVEQMPFLGENGVMMKRKVLASVLVLLIALGVLSAAEVRVEFPRNHSDSVMLPVDAVIGQTADRDSDGVLQSLALALKEEYSFEWTQNHIAEQSRASLVRLFGTWFSENLPADTVLFSVPLVNADGTVGVNVRIGSSCMAFLLQGNMIVSMRLL